MKAAMPRASALALTALCGLAACADGSPMDLPSDRDLAFSATEETLDDFDPWHPTDWIAETHALGLGWFEEGNVEESGGILSLVFPAGTRDGGEIRSRDRLGFGTYEVNMRAADLPGTLSAFFLYESGARRDDEVDIEIQNGTRTIWFTTWSRGKQTNSAEATLSFDPAAAFHTYRIDYCRRTVAFSVDGAQLAEFTHRTPSKDMFLMANAWWPVWLAGTPASEDRSVDIDWIRLVPGNC